MRTDRRLNAETGDLRYDPEIANLVAALSVPDFLFETEVKPSLEKVADPLVWQRLIELDATERWKGRLITGIVENPVERTQLQRRIQALLLPGPDPTVEDAKRQGLRASLHRSLPLIPLIALEVLARRGDAEAAADVREMLASADLDVKLAAIAALGRLGGPVASEVLVTALAQEHSVVAEAITRAMIQVGEAAVPLLITAIESSVDSVRWHAAEALAAMGDPRSLTGLVSALDDADPAVRWWAARGLARLGNPGLLGLLRSLEANPGSPALAQGLRYAIDGVSSEQRRQELLPIADALASGIGVAALCRHLEQELSRLAERSTSEPEERVEVKDVKTLPDSEIRRAIIEEFETDPKVEEMLLGVEVYDGVATLVGFVSHEEKRLAALEAAKRVPGVREVVDDIHITLTGD